MPETQFLFFTKWQEQKRRKFNIDPYMLIRKTRIQKTGIPKQKMDYCKTTDLILRQTMQVWISESQCHALQSST